MALDDQTHEDNMAFLTKHRVHTVPYLTRPGGFRPIDVILKFRANKPLNSVVEPNPRPSATDNSSSSTSSAVERHPAVSQQTYFAVDREKAGSSQSLANHETGQPVDGIRLLLQVVNEATSPGVSQNSNITESCAYALQILRVVTLVPSTYEKVCAGVIKSADDASVSGIGVLLEATNGGNLVDIEPEVIVSALEVLCNCCSPACGDDKMQRNVRSLARHNNALMVLLRLLRYNQTPREADRIQYLACLALLGLARNRQVAQVLDSLQIVTTLSQITRSEPVLVENKAIHRKLRKVALELIRYTSLKVNSTNLGIVVDAADATDNRLNRAAIVAHTQVSFNQKELLLLIRDHLKSRGLRHAARALTEDARLDFKNPAKPKAFSWPSASSRAAPTPTATIRHLRQDSISRIQSSKKRKLNLGSAVSKSVDASAMQVSTPFLKKMNQRNGTPARLRKSSTFPPTSTPESASKLSNKLMSPPAPTFAQGGHALGNLPNHASYSFDVCQPQTGLEKIVQDYLREQHSECPKPICVLPPFSLTEKHHCPDHEAPSAPRNAVARLARSKIEPRFGGRNGRSLTRRLVHSRSRWTRTYRVDAAMDSMANPNMEGPTIFTVSSFLNRPGSDDELLLGTVNGDMIRFNVWTCELLSRYELYNLPVSSIQVSPSSTEILACSEDSSTANLFRLDSDTGAETQLHSWDDVAAVQMAHSGSAMIATVGGNSSAARMYEFETGTCVRTFEDVSCNNYIWHRACFSPGDDLVLHDGLLWDIRASRPIHKFDKLSTAGQAVFHPNGTQVIINSAVWDLKTYKLMQTCEALDHAVAEFDKRGEVIYSFHPNLEVSLLNKSKQSMNNMYYTSFSVTDAEDYSNIATKDAERNIYDLCLDGAGRHVAVIVGTDANSDEFPSSVCRLYEVGRVKPYEDDSDIDDARSDSEDEEQYSHDEERSDEDGGQGDEDDDEDDDHAMGEHGLFGASSEDEYMST